MTKFLGFIIFASWTGTCILVGHYIFKQSPIPPIQTAQTCPESKERVIFLAPYPDPVEEEYENYEDDYEDLCGEDIDLNKYKPRIVVKESKKKNNKQIMLGVQSSGNIEARYNHPISNNWGIYVEADTGKNVSVGASFSF